MGKIKYRAKVGAAEPRGGKLARGHGDMGKIKDRAKVGAAEPRGGKLARGHGDMGRGRSRLVDPLISWPVGQLAGADK